MPTKPKIGKSVPKNIRFLTKSTEKNDIFPHFAKMTVSGLINKVLRLSTNNFGGKKLFTEPKNYFAMWLGFVT